MTELLSADAARTARIAGYFDETVPYYERFWSGPTRALHFGLRIQDARSHYDELEQTNCALATLADLRVGERVLDAGCGVGGSSIWMATRRGVEVVGVTLSAVQVRHASEAARRAGCGERVRFLQRDYAATGLDAGAFDVVWALESACYSADPTPLLREAYRLLRPGGRMVVADGFTRRRPRGLSEGWLHRQFTAGLVLPDLSTTAEFVAAMDAVGFVEPRVQVRSAEVVPSCRRLFWRCTLTYPLAVLARRLGLTSDLLLANSRAGIAAFPLLRRGVLEYALLVAHKR